MAFPDPAAVPYNLESEDGTPYSRHIDLDFLEIQNTLNSVLTCLQLIERDDGMIRNGSVTPDSFDGSALAFIAGATSGPTRWIPRGAWVGPGTAYEVTDIVETGTPAVSYVCVTAHVSSASFVTDHEVDHLWVVLSAPRSLVSADIVSALGYTPVNRAGDTMTGPLIAPTNTRIAGVTFVAHSSAPLTARLNGKLYVNYADTGSGNAEAFSADVVRASGTDPVVAVNVTGYAGGGVYAFGFGGQAVLLAGNTTGGAFAGGATLSCMEPDNTGQKVGQTIFFQNRLNSADVAGSYSYALPSGTLSDPGGGLSTNQYNRHSVAIKIDSQERSPTGEYCGWGRGIKFAEYALDSEFDAAYTGSRAYPIGIDFSEMHYYGGTDPVTGFNMEAAIAFRDQPIWWNRDPNVAVPHDRVKTHFNSFNGRLVTTLEGIEKFGIDVNAGTIYLNGVLFSSVGTGTNNVWTGTNTFNNTVTIGANEVFSGFQRRIMGDMSTGVAANRLSVQTSVAGDATEFQILPGAGGGTSSGMTVFTDPLVVAGGFGRISIADGVEMLIESGRLGASAYLPMVFNTSGADQMTLALDGSLRIGTASAPVSGGKLRVNGLVQIDNPAAFSVNRAGVNFNVVDSTVTPVTWTAEAFDTGNYFDTGTGRFTPPAGYYHFSATATALGSVDGGEMTVSLYKNGSALHNGSRVSMASGTVQAGATLSCTVYANGTDYFDLRVYQDNPTVTTLSFAGDAVQLHFSGHRVG